MYTYVGKPGVSNVSGDQTLNITSNTEKVVLTCEVTGDDIYTMYWIRTDGFVLPVSRNHTVFNVSKLSFTIRRVHPHDSGGYRCVVHSPWGDAESNIVQVLIVAAPPVFIIQPTDITAVALETVTFTSEAEGFHVRYEWRYYSDNINSSSYSVKSNSSTLTLHSVTPLDEGYYCCVAVTGKDNKIFSNNATLTVNGNEYQLYKML